LREKIASTGITGELNPSSNLPIGNLGDLNPAGCLPVDVCIGSDDPLTSAPCCRPLLQTPTR
jgi:hypothetical protein